MEYEICKLIHAADTAPIPPNLLNPKHIIHGLLIHILENKCNIAREDYKIIIVVEAFIVLYKDFYPMIIRMEDYQEILEDFLCSNICDVNYRKLIKQIRGIVATINDLYNCKIHFNSPLLSKLANEKLELLLNDKKCNNDTLFSVVGQEIGTPVTLEQIKSANEKLPTEVIIAKYFCADETIGQEIIKQFRNNITTKTANYHARFATILCEFEKIKKINTELLNTNARLVTEIKKLRTQINEFDIMTNAKIENRTDASTSSTNVIARIRSSPLMV